MARGKSQKLNLSPGQSREILQMMVNDGVITRESISVYTARLDEEAQGLMERLKSLGYAVSHSVTSAARTAAEGLSERVTATKAPRTRKNVRKAAGVSPERTAEIAETRRQQGRYMSLSRQIGDRDLVRERFGPAAIREHGKAEVISMMEAHLRDAGGEQSSRTTSRKRTPSPAAKGRRKSGQKVARKTARKPARPARRSTKGKR